MFILKKKKKKDCHNTKLPIEMEGSRLLSKFVMQKLAKKKKKLQIALTNSHWPFLKLSEVFRDPKCDP